MIHARVIVVHDVPAVRNLVMHALETEGCTAIGAEDCRSAIAIAAIDPPDVIVADERLIDADPGAFQEMREQFRKAVVVALGAPMRHRTAAKHPGVDCTVEKPAREDQLVRAVQWALELNAPETADAQA